MKLRKLLPLLLGSLSCASLCTHVRASTLADQSTGQEIIHANSHPDTWLTYGRTYDEHHYSPLDQINRDNVSRLKLAWYAPFDATRGQEGTPLMVNGVMYATTNFSKVMAIKADTGQVLWTYDPKVPGSVGVKACCDSVNRGAAYWDGKVIEATLDGRLIALDAKTGRLIWSTDTIPKDASLGAQKAYTVDGAVRVAKGLVFIGNGGAEFGARGFVSAFDAQTGQLKWRFYLVPNNKNLPDHAPSDNILRHKAYKSWGKDGVWVRQGGGGTAWDSIVYDPVTDLLYIGGGNGSPWNYKYRSDGVGSNLFVGSIVAVRPETGQYVWHFQETPMDTWDYTSVQQIMPIDLPIEGRMRHVIVHAPKNGFFYIVDARTGKFLAGRNYAYQNWATGLDPLTGRPIFRPQALWGLAGDTWYGIPGPEGAHNIQAMAFSPRTHLLYMPIQQIPFTYKNQKGGFTPHPHSYNTGIDVLKMSVPDNPHARGAYVRDEKGALIAWDPVKMQRVWTVNHGGPWNGGLLATAGDVIFQGLANGEFHAYDAENGKDLFSFQSQSGIIATPMTYSINGKQYVAVEVGWGGSYPVQRGHTSRSAGWTVNHSFVMAFSLDGKTHLPQFNQIGSMPVKPPAHYNKKEAEKGYFEYETYCSMCHGDNAEGAGVLPDLRWTGALKTRDAFYHVVGEGALTAYGMDSFKEDMSPQEIDSIRQFLIKRAHATYEREMRARDYSPKVPKRPVLGI